MSGSNALAAAKRRRVEGASKPSAPLARPNNSQQRPQTQPRASASATLPAGKLQNPTNSNQRPTQNANVVLQKNQFTSDRMNQNGKSLGMSNDENSNNIFLIPNPPQGINPLELLKVHHIFINRLAGHLPPALETLGENFNTMSVNCDNLNDRLEVLEKNGGVSNGGVSNGGVSNGGGTSLDNESQKKIELLNNTVTSLSKSLEELKNSFLKLQAYAMEKELENNKFKNEMSSKHSHFSKDIDGLRQPITQLQEEVAELRNFRNVEEEDEDQVEEAQVLNQESLQEAEQEDEQEAEQEDEQEDEQEQEQEQEAE